MSVCSQHCGCDCGANDSGFNLATLGALKRVRKSKNINARVINVQHKAKNGTVGSISPVIACVIRDPGQAF